MKIGSINMRWYFWPAIFAAAVLLYIAIIIVGNRTYRTIEIESLSAGSTAPLTDNSITVTTWNLGYGGLGAESDFVADGGAHLLPPSRAVVEKNITGIVEELKETSSDVILIQEAARASFLTRSAEILGAVDTALAGRDNAFSADFTVRFAPNPYGPQHGLYSSTRIVDVEREVFPLPHEPGYLMGISRRLYHLHIVRIPFSGGEWSIINVHLSAFDEGANIRLEQLRAVLDFADQEYEKGNYVIIGGDWNLELAQPLRPSTTEEKYLFWLYPFPENELKEGWRIVADQTTPSVRTNERPYNKGENFTTTIDGFVISPNVSAESISTTDFDFQYTDHQPVTAKFQAVTQ